MTRHRVRSAAFAALATAGFSAALSLARIVGWNAAGESRDKIWRLRAR